MLGMPDFNSDYDAFDYRAEIRDVFAWVPRCCCISNRWMWLTTITMGTAVWTGPGTPAIEKRYYNKAEYIIKELKQ